MASFELTIEQLRARRGNKWRRFPPEVLPAPVADMDFAVPDEVQDAIEAITKLPAMEAFLRQGLQEASSFDETRRLLLALA